LAARSLTAAFAAVMLALAPLPASAAAADTLSLHGAPAVTAPEMVVINASGEVDGSFPGGAVEMSYKLAGGSTCADTPAADPGTTIAMDPISDSFSAGQGAYGTFGTFSVSSPGRYLICAWLTTDTGAVSAVAQVIQVVNEFRASITVTVRGKGTSCVPSPSQGNCGGGISYATHPELVARFAVNGPGLLSVDVRRATGPECAPNPAAEPPSASFLTQTGVTSTAPGSPIRTLDYLDVGQSGDQLSPFIQFFGPPSEAGTLTGGFTLRRGRWRVCAWVSRPPDPRSDAMFGAVAAGPVELTFPYPTVGLYGAARRPAGTACVVPRVVGRSLRAARRALRAAHCRVGDVVRRRRATHGLVVSQRPRAGAQRPAGATVSLVVGE
jgi:hypothetical protein